MKLPTNKTKIVCTMGPASDSPEVIGQMLLAGMNVARLNFSHGDFAGHQRTIARIREAARLTSRRVALMADLPGPKIRIGQLAKEPIELAPGDLFSLTVDAVTGDERRVSVSFERLTEVVRTGDSIFLNDGVIQLEVLAVEGNDVRTRVVVGGELRSRKGMNLPGIDLGMSAFTAHDHACLKFALENGVDAVSQSFVETADDVRVVREAARALGHDTFIIAKIERAKALEHAEAIFQAADGIMIARGDLGVEIPIEQIPVVQKQLMRQANLLGKPVITATHMLESMVQSRRPTRAEVTDVANAILDGTDCVMLSAESAVGRYPVDAVAMLVKIASTIEPHQASSALRELLERSVSGSLVRPVDVVASSVARGVQHVSPALVIVPTLSGASARNVARFRLPVWIAAVSVENVTCQRLQFSYGVHPVYQPEEPEDWRAFAKQWLHKHDLDGKLVILTGGPSEKHPEANNRMEILDLDGA